MRDLKRLISFLCVLALTAGLVVVPAGAAMPMLDAPAVEELPGDVGTMPGHDHVDTPALDERAEAELSAAVASHAYNFDSTAGDSYVTMSNANNASAAYTWNGIKFTKGTKMESKTTITFETIGDAKVTLVLTDTGRNINIDGKSTAIPKEEMTFEVSAGQHTLTKASSSGTNVVLYYLMWEPVIPSCDVHDWGDWSEDNATCTESGTKTRVCTVCKETETIETDPTGHTAVPFAEEPATCVEEGRAAGTVCSECEALLTGGETIPATGEHKDTNGDGACDACGKTPLAAAHDTHSFTIELRNTATCTAAGVKIMQCDVTNCDVTTTVPSAALGHNWKDVEAKSATCTAIGWSAHQACARCDAKQNYKQIPALGHKFNADGQCERCDATMDTAGMNAGGWFEALYAEIDGVTDAQVAQVIYSGPVSGTLEDEDLEYLVRDAALASGKSGVRIDIPGIPAGTYSLLVVTTSGIPYSATGIQVQEYDRSGYAHWNYTDGVGAYRDDGILKDNAIVLYVTEGNKNTVTLTAPDGTTVTGIGNILNSTGEDKGGGKTDKGGTANTNQGILRKLADADIPLVVRIVGDVKSVHPAPAAGGIEGLTDYDSVNNGGSTGDNGNMARMARARNVTIEGIGTDATINGWGIHFMAHSDDLAAGRGRSFEVRNVAFRNVPEDCLGMEGAKGSMAVERCWIHNCAFYAPAISPAAESDKKEGDGACDFKRGQYMTMAYCYYEGYHKTNLIGADKANEQYNITWHHNYWKDCNARGPLSRNANIHIYNCIYENQTDYAQDARANTYIFSEYNMLLNCNRVAVTNKEGGGTIKSYKDAISGNNYISEAKIVEDKDEKVTSNNKYASFELDSKLSYIPTGDYKLDKDHGVARANIMAYTGPMKAEIITPDDVKPDIEADRTPDKAVVLPYDKAMNNTTVPSAKGTYDNIIFNAGSVNGDAVKVGKNVVGKDIVFMVDQAVDITVTGTAINLVNAAGAALVVDSGTASNVPAGIYYIQASVFNKGQYKEGTVTGLKIVATVDTTPPHDHSFGDYKVTRAATCTVLGLETATCSCGETGTRELPKIDHNYVDGVCEMCGLREGVYDPNAGGDDTPTAPTVVAVTGITLNQESVEVDQDGAYTLVPTVQPANATRKTVTWTSDDPDVAIVSNSGVVTGKKSGTTTITATTKDGNFTASCTVTVIGITKTEKKFVANDYGPKPQVNKKDPAVAEADVTAIETTTGNAFTLDKVAGTWKMNGDKTYLVTASKGGNALEFTITKEMNTVTVSVSSTGDSNYSVVALLNEAGQRVADKAGVTVRAVKGKSTTTITFENLAAGTYRIVSPDVTSAEVGGVSGYESRGVGIHAVTVTELQRETAAPAIVQEGNLGEVGNQVAWTLDSVGQLAITNTDNHIATDDAVLVALWGDNDKFLGVKLIRASQLTATVGQNWDHLKLIWVNNKYAPRCDAETVTK